MNEYERGYTDGYKEGWKEATAVAAEQAGMRLSRKATDTQRNAVNLTVPRSGTKLRHIWDLFVDHGDNGLTDDEIEHLTGYTHQSASGARNMLMTRGLLKDSGLRRKNRRGLAVIVWIPLSPPSKEPDVRSSTDDSGHDDPGRLHQRDYYADQQRLEGLWP